jgi:hypothetical protein
MIIVKLMGGLGNQMFQYALGRQLSTKYNTPLKLDLSFLLDRSPRENFTYRNYDLSIFNIKEDFTTKNDIARFKLSASDIFSQLEFRIRQKFNPTQIIVEKSCEFDSTILNTGKMFT